MFLVNGKLRIEGADGDTLTIRTYRVENGVRVTNNILQIDFTTGDITTLGGLQEFQLEVTC